MSFISMGLLSYFPFIAGFAACVIIPFCIYKVLYNLSFHPLKKYPGPWLARVSDCYAGYYALRRSLPWATFKDHQEHGDVMRYGPDRLVFNTASALRDIYRNPDVTKSEVYLFSIAGSQPFIFNTLGRAAHLRKRKIISPALSERSMRDFQPTMIEQIDIFIDLIRAAGSSPINVSTLLRRLAMDIAINLGFGTSLNLQTTKTYDIILTGMSIANFRVNSYMNFPFLSKLQFDLILQNTPMRKMWRKTVSDMVQARLKEEPDAKHDLYYFVNNNLEAEAKDMQSSELFAESLFFLSAAGDTISSALAGSFFYLSRYPECYQRLCQEIRTTFNSDSDIGSREKLKECRYLRACINEALRMTPPLGGTLWREAIDDNQPFIVDGHVIPPGTMVGVNTYSIHHNEKYFPESFVFNPDRWLVGDRLTTDEDDRTDVAHTPEMHQAFNAFSVGIRSCAGKSMAYLEASLIIAKVIWHFDFYRSPGPLGEIGCVYKHTSSGNKPEYHTLDAITSRHDGPYLNFVPRK